MEIEPVDDSCLQAASYDMRVGHETYVSSAYEKIDVANETGIWSSSIRANSPS
jgi:deoxycytidine triphosphate deaminase